jgi:hypothetical protein
LTASLSFFSRAQRAAGPTIWPALSLCSTTTSDRQIRCFDFDVAALFAPVLSLMGQFLATSDNEALANEQRRSLDAKLAAIKKAVGHASGHASASSAARRLHAAARGVDRRALLEHARPRRGAARAAARRRRQSAAPARL